MLENKNKYVEKAKTSDWHYTQLAIIGNGFDIAHGLRTKYTQFINATDESLFVPFRNYLIKYCGNDDNWSDFEACIEKLTMQCFLYSIACNSKEVYKDVHEINSLFKDLQYHLMQYLITESERNRDVKLSSLERYLGSDTKAISFNYTDTAKRYTDNIYYVHGSLAENEIILGYDYRNEPCLIGYDEMRWGKMFCRERLLLSRHLKGDLYLDMKCDEYRSLLDDYEMIKKLQNSGKGLEDEDFDKLQNKEFMIKYLAEEPSKPLDVMPPCDYTKIKKIIVMGHGIVADRVLLSSMMEQCINLDEIVIFTYDGEVKDSLDMKYSFFKPFCVNINSEAY